METTFEIVNALWPYAGTVMLLAAIIMLVHLIADIFGGRDGNRNF